MPKPNCTLLTTANTLSIQSRNTLSSQKMDIYSLFLGYKRKVPAYAKALNLLFYNMGFLIVLILGSSMMKVRLQGSCLPTKDMMFGSATAEETNILETILNIIPIKVNNFGNLLSNTWQTMIFQHYSHTSTK